MTDEEKRAMTMWKRYQARGRQTTLNKQNQALSKKSKQRLNDAKDKSNRWSRVNRQRKG